MADSTFSAAEEPQAAPSASASFGSLLFQAPDFSAVRKRPVVEADSAENDDDAQTCGRFLRLLQLCLHQYFRPELLHSLDQLLRRAFRG